MDKDFIKATTEYIFLRDEPKRADVIFIPGCMNYLLPEYAAHLCNSGFAKYIIPSGRHSITRGELTRQSPREKYRFDGDSEAEFFAHVLRANGVAEDAILCECESEYTYQNAFFTRALTDREGICVNKALLVCRPFHARRAYSYYKWAFPDTDILVCPAEKDEINAENWFLTESGTDRVLGELKRISDYFASLVQEAVKINI